MSPKRTTKKKNAETSASTKSATGPAADLASFPLGSTGKLHPPFGLGLWALGRWAREDEARTKAAVGRALERRIRWFDTAEVYGNGRSERLLGEVLSRAGAGATTPFLVTKVSWEHLRASQVRAACLASLHRLGRSSVDVYLVHAPDSHTPIQETMRALEDLWKEQRIGAVGVSNFSSQQLEAAGEALREAPLVVNQVRYNLFDREEGEEVLEACRKHRIVMEAYTPFARGLLVGRYLDGERPSDSARRFSRRFFEGDQFPEMVRRAQRLRELAVEAKVPMASIALHWLLRQGVAPVFGASRPEQVDEVVESSLQRPSDAILDRADEIARGNRA